MGVVKQINIKNRTCYFYNDMINIKPFDPILLKIDRRSSKPSVFTKLDILQFKKLMIVKLFTVLILCICLLIMETEIEEKNKNKYFIFDSADKNKELLKNTMMFGAE